ncbi:unnamed protein product [Rotaria sordida]|uniref:EF-hand domain-containing protein n=1 Tax=Rotaria sordida TaxID=392033 RepID=A0A815FNV9_9BILA|nr:unnamed protein product [Rotaria sordida]
MWGRRKSLVPKELNAAEMSTLVQAAHVSEEEIRRLHSDFLAQYPSGRLDKKSFIEYYGKFNPNAGAQDSFGQIFDMIDSNNDGTIDFNELLVVIVLTSRLNNIESQLSFAFDMWDESNDGRIDQKELADAISAIYDYTGVADRKGDRDPKKRAKEIIKKLDISGDKKLSKEEFIKGCQNDPIIRDLLVPRR